MAKTKTDKIIRRVVLGKTYNIFSIEMKKGVPNMKLLEQDIEYVRRPTEAEMIAKHKVDKVVIIATATKIGHYGVSIEEFMKIATLEKTETKKMNEEAEKVEESAETETETENN